MGGQVGVVVVHQVPGVGAQLVGHPVDKAGRAEQPQPLVPAQAQPQQPVEIGEVIHMSVGDEHVADPQQLAGGQGAQRFAVRHGFPIENLLTDRARRAWLKWKENLNPNDDWLDDNQRDFVDEGEMEALLGAPFTYGTIHCSAVNQAQDLAGVTTTSGLSYKIPGRVGDSPIVGAGMYVDNNIGAAGATGRGEGLDLRTAARAIVLAAASNTVVKGGIVLSAGSKALRKVILPGLVLTLATAIGVVFLL